MRLFTGIPLPADVLANLEAALVHLRPTAEVRWSPAANFHITTKFIGQLAGERLDEVTSALKNLPRRQPFAIEIRGLGWFPNPHSPRIFWSGVHGGDALRQLAMDSEQALVPLGVPVEQRAYSPHLTLARIEHPSVLAPLRHAVANLPSSDFGRFIADRFLLYRSITSPTGSTYTVLDEFPL